MLSISGVTVAPLPLVARQLPLARRQLPHNRLTAAVRQLPPASESREPCSAVPVPLHKREPQVSAAAAVALIAISRTRTRRRSLFSKRSNRHACAKQLRITNHNQEICPQQISRSGRITATASSPSTRLTLTIQVLYACTIVHMTLIVLICCAARAATVAAVRDSTAKAPTAARERFHQIQRQRRLCLRVPDCCSLSLCHRRLNATEIAHLQRCST